MPDHQPQALLATSVRWIAVAQAARIGAQLISVAVLARLLAADAYGLIAMAMTVTNFAFLFRDLGTMVAIIQRRTLPDQMMSTLYWLNLGLALLLAAALAMLATPLAELYHEPRLAPVLTVLALVFPLSGLAAVQQALLERASRFRLLARIEAFSALGGVALALLVAWQGGQVWSLVAQMLLGTALSTVQLWLAMPWRPRWRLSSRALRSVLDFSTHFSLFQLLTYLQRNADSMIIGRLLGPAALGVYAMAYKTMAQPLQQITGIASRALVPAMSRAQDAPERLAELFLRASTVVTLLAAPLMAGLLALRTPFVLLVLGPRWSAVVALMPWLALLGLVQALATIPASLLLALGKSRRMLWLGMLGALLQVVGFLLATRWGVRGIAASYCLSSLLMLWPLHRAALQCVPLAPGRLLCALAPPLAAATLMLLAVAATQRALTSLAPLPQLALCILLGSLVYGGLVFPILPNHWRARLLWREARP